LIFKHRGEIEAIKKEADEAVKEQKKEQKKLSARLEKFKTANEKVKLLLEERKKLEARFEYQVKENKRLQDRCHELYDMYAKQRLNKLVYIDDNENLEGQVKRLEQEIEGLKGKQNPLLLVGIAVRKRFLEQARSVVPNFEDGTDDEVEEREEDYPHRLEDFDFVDSGTFRTGWGAPSRAIIEEGNAAAHDGNLAADAALWDLGYLENKVDQKLYKALYQVDARYGRHEASYLRKIRNCQATVVTTIMENDAESNTKKATLEYLARLSKLVRTYEDNLWEEELESDLEGWVKDAKKATVQFVENHRRR
jgi:hypothetical protein